jgi:hypothetical protein
VSGQAVRPDEDAVSSALRAAGARFAFVHRSRAGGTAARPDSDLDRAAWWGCAAPASWEVELPAYVDLVVLDQAPLWLAGRVAQHGRLLFDDTLQRGFAGRPTPDWSTSTTARR